jgi:choice-of-anchor A domain-containing protein
MFSLLHSTLPTPRTTLRPRSLPRLEGLEAREVPAASPVDLGAAGHYAVLGLQNTDIINGNATLHGDAGVSRGGSLVNRALSAIDGDVHTFGRNQYSGRGSLTGSVIISPSDMREANDDATEAARDAAALTPTRTLNAVNRATTLTGNGGVNVIRIRGDISSSLTLTGTADDVFVVNVSGSMDLRSRFSLSVSGGVSADNVLYNFVGRGGNVRTRGNSVVDGTMLALNRNLLIGGDVNGGLIGGGNEIRIRDDATVGDVVPGGDEPPPVQLAQLSGVVWEDMNLDAVVDADEFRFSGFHVFLTDANGQTFTAQTLEDGSFTFTDLTPGTYRLNVNYPPATSLTPGTAGGVADPMANTITDIVLSGGVHATGYLFAESTMV